MIEPFKSHRIKLYNTFTTSCKRKFTIRSNNIRKTGRTAKMFLYFTMFLCFTAQYKKHFSPSVRLFLSLFKCISLHFLSFYFFLRFLIKLSMFSPRDLIISISSFSVILSISAFTSPADFRCSFMASKSRAALHFNTI